MAPGVAHAAWPNTPFVNVPVGATNGEQVYPAITSDGSGGAFIAWHDNRTGSYDLYVQRIGLQGAPVWTVNGLSIGNAANDQANAQLLPDGTGGVFVVWHDARSGAFDIYMQRLNGNGVPQWTANGVAVATVTGIQSNPQLVTDGAGGAIVTWQDARSVNYDIYAQRVNAAGVPQWTANGVPVCTATNEQSGQTLVSDGAGGAILTWQDSRSGGFDIYGQRLNGAGTPQWTVNGLAITTAPSTQANPMIVTDGGGGAFIVWWDLQAGLDQHDVYVHQVTATGFIPGLPRPISTASGTQTNPRMIADGLGGAFIVWEDFTAPDGRARAQRIDPFMRPMWAVNGIPFTATAALSFQVGLTALSDGAGGLIVAWQDSYNIFAQRVLPTGSQSWGPDGRMVSHGWQEKTWTVITGDGSGGAIVAWHDLRNGSRDVYAQRFDHYGYLGTSEPIITSVRDVANDQGGQVKVTFAASYLDADPVYAIEEYRLWRSAPTASAPGSAALDAGRTMTADPDEAVASGALWAPSGVSAGVAWEYVDAQPAALVPSYNFIAATTSDSLPSSNPRTLFMVEGRGAGGASARHWYSPPDSGYSVDNLAPTAPLALTGQYAAGTTSLHWMRNGEIDFASYRVYRGTTGDFAPGPSNLVATLPDTGYVDPNGAAGYYKLSAVDIHGNESVFATYPSSTIDVPSVDRPVALALARPLPNPAQGATRITFELPRAAAVTLTIHDAAGRTVRELLRGPRDAGGSRIAWNLRDDAGQLVPSGVYFIRLAAGGRNLMQRMVVLR